MNKRIMQPEVRHCLPGSQAQAKRWRQKSFPTNCGWILTISTFGICASASMGVRMRACLSFRTRSWQWLGAIDQELRSNFLPATRQGSWGIRARFSINRQFHLEPRLEIAVEYALGNCSALENRTSILPGTFHPSDCGVAPSFKRTSK